MKVFFLLKCLLSCLFVLLCLNGKLLCMNAAGFVGHQPLLVWQKAKRAEYALRQSRQEVGSHHQTAGTASAKTFLELILGVVDTLQFGKRKIGTPS